MRSINVAVFVFALGSRVKVANKKTGESVEVTITDRGPFIKNRTMDLSKAAAKVLVWAVMVWHQSALSPLIQPKTKNNIDGLIRLIIANDANKFISK